MFTDEPAGKPVRLTTKVTVAAVMLLAASLVTTIVIVALPDTVDSAFVIGGTSFAGDNVAVNVGLVGVVGVGELLLLQPAASRASTTAMGDRRFIVRLSFSQ
jgi:hypothetical protein